MISCFTRSKWKEFYKENKNRQGVYYIRSDGKLYVGSSIGISERISEHFTHLRGNRHCNKELQESYNQFGEELVEFGVIEYVTSKSVLRVRELELAKEHNAFADNGGFTRRVVTSDGVYFISENQLDDHDKINKKLFNKKVVRINVKHPEIVVYPSLKEAKKFCSWVDQGLDKKPKRYLTHDATYCWMWFSDFEQLTDVSAYVKRQVAMYTHPHRVFKETNYTVLDTETGVFYDSLSELYDTFNFQFAKPQIYKHINKLDRFVVTRTKKFEHRASTKLAQ